MTIVKRKFVNVKFTLDKRLLHNSEDKSMFKPGDLVWTIEEDDGQIAHILFTLKQFFDALLDAICDFP